MTRPRNDQHSTEFGLWLRNQREIDSKLGYIATNIDYKWENYKTGQWMFIEEKRHGSYPAFSQHKQFRMLDDAQTDSNYCGFWLLSFENTSPDDGRIWLTRLAKTPDEIKVEITKEQLLGFLKDFALL
jgi:hypothetical protein